ncbi:MAG: DUF4270 domain-containing protein [Alistipes sp.]|jgi:hypothetical protein|nr:DUF4270 domain-containing protein [Alistipes sp.]
MNYSTDRDILRGIAALVVAAFFVMAPAACTKVDDRLGADLIPINQRMEIEVTSPENGVVTHLFRERAIPSSRRGSAWIGRTVDEHGVFGKQTSSALLQFVPATLPYAEAEGYGIDPIVDSVLILFSLNSARGDTTVVQKFDVWDVRAAEGVESLHRDSVYYTDFEMEGYRGEKLFEFTHSGRRNVEARLFPTAAGKKYLDSLVRLHDWDDYIDDSLFYKKFQGLYITPAEDSPAGALYGAGLDGSGLQLFVRNHDTLDVSAIYDTVVTLFTFRDSDIAQSNTSPAVSYDNVSINMTTFDYTGSVLGTLEAQTNGFTDTLPGSAPLSTLYVQSMGGVGTMLRFTDEMVEEIRGLRYKTDPATGERVEKDVAINQALMKIWLADDSNVSLDNSAARLGSYLNPKQMTPIPDYQYVNEVLRNQELQQQGSTEVYMLPYNGYLNRSNAYYELDITSYIQQLAREKEDDPEHMYVSPTIFLAPEAYGIIGGAESVLKGLGSDQPVSIRITYTIIEG